MHIGLPLIQNLTAVEKECSIFFSWNRPYLLPGLSASYKVYINGTLQITTNLQNHTYYPNVASSTVYNMSVATYNESIGDGKIVENIFKFCISKLGPIRLLVLLMHIRYHS